tara:strand:- start:2480 stop:3586 length:1107 start_codon:yes stop_codon:yes gene_type:complete
MFMSIKATEAIVLPGVFSNKRKYLYIIFLSLITALIILTLFSIGIGAVFIPVDDVIKIIMHQFLSTAIQEELIQSEVILIAIRLPRVLMCLLIGATLAVCGAVLQGLFRNPLADPQLIGVSSGAALGAAISIILGPSLNKLLPEMEISSILPFMAFFGGFAATTIVYRISSKHGKTSVSTMLLSGIAINALCGSIIGYLIFLADDNQIRDLTFWTLGSLNGSSWKSLYAIFPFLIFTIVVLPFFSSKLNVILLGEEEAKYLGVDVDKLKKYMIFLASLGVGACVAVSGIIGFIGLVVPHLVRLIIGPDLRILIPASIILGATLLLCSDLIARTVVAPTELPIGIVTSLLGAPFFIWLLIKNRSLQNYL